MYDKNILSHVVLLLFEVNEALVEKQFECMFSGYTISFALFNDLRFFKMNPLEYLPGVVNVIHNSFEYIIEPLVAFVLLNKGTGKKNIYTCILIRIVNLQ